LREYQLRDAIHWGSHFLGFPLDSRHDHRAPAADFCEQAYPKAARQGILRIEIYC
jgi:hypothetical protein